MILAILNVCVTVMPPIKFGSIRLTVWEELSFEEFQNGRHGDYPWYRNGTILAILNHCVTMMSPVKFWLHPTYGLGGDVVWSISRWRWRPSWIAEQKDFSNSEFLCHCDASHQVLAQSDLRFWRRRRLKNFKMSAVAAILDIGTKWF